MAVLTVFQWHSDGISNFKGHWDGNRNNISVYRDSLIYKAKFSAFSASRWPNTFFDMWAWPGVFEIAPVLRIPVRGSCPKYVGIRK